MTLGALGVLIGIGFMYPQWWYKLVVIMGFILLTSPVSSSAIARAFYIAGVRRWHSHNDATLKHQNTTEMEESATLQKETS